MNRTPLKATTAKADRLERRQRDPLGLEEATLTAPHDRHVPTVHVTGAAMAGSRLYRGPMASVKQIQVTFDCAEPERVARFWCEVLGYVVPPPPEGVPTWDDFDRTLPLRDQGSSFACVDPLGVGPRLYFQRVPEGKVVKNRLHLDVRVGTGLVGEARLSALEAECARLVSLGALRVRLLPADGENESCLVMQDIEGNEFCLD
jgi:glyoxalase superfamily protein